MLLGNAKDLRKTFLIVKGYIRSVIEFLYDTSLRFDG